MRTGRKLVHLSANYYLRVSSRALSCARIAHLGRAEHPSGRVQYRTVFGDMRRETRCSSPLLRLILPLPWRSLSPRPPVRRVAVHVRSKTADAQLRSQSECTATSESRAIWGMFEGLLSTAFLGNRRHYGDAVRLYLAGLPVYRPSRCRL